MKPCTNPLPRRYLSHGILIAIAIEKLIGVMRAGEILHLHFENRRPHWNLSGGCDVDAEIARAVLDHPEMELQTDALPLAGGASPQTFVIKQKE